MMQQVLDICPTKAVCAAPPNSCFLQKTNKRKHQQQQSALITLPVYLALAHRFRGCSLMVLRW